MMISKIYNMWTTIIAKPNKFKRKTVLVHDTGKKVISRHKVYFGDIIYFVWFGDKFPLKLNDDGTVTIKNSYVRGYNRVYPGVFWKEDKGQTENIIEAEF